MDFASNLDAGEAKRLALSVLGVLKYLFYFIGFVMSASAVYGLFVKEDRGAQDRTGEIVKEATMFLVGVTLWYLPIYLKRLLEG